ncbi:MAG: hypothetical protein V3T30_06465, partial [Thermodesulfobacteriota bacterium]
CNAGAKKEVSGCKGAAAGVAKEFGIPVKVVNKGLDYVEIVRNPRHGYGKGINPCVDCRLYMFRAAKEYMAEIGASFVVTGEVLGQRPMSQRRDNFSLIEEESGLKGLILRPLCAKNLEPTIPELEGIVDREKLMNITGRGRRELMDLADNLEISDYPCPSGGCLLTDKIFSKKVRDLLKHKKDVTINDLQLLKSGRHFRYDGVKIVVGRDDADNMKLEKLAAPGDTFIEPANFQGPVALISGESRNGAREFAGGIIMRYAAGKAPEGALLKATCGGVSTEFKAPPPLEEAIVKERNVC